MIIKKVNKESKVPLNAKIDESLQSDLQLYRECYKEVFEDDISLNEAVEELLKAVLIKDKEFQRFKKNK